MKRIVIEINAGNVDGADDIGSLSVSVKGESDNSGLGPACALIEEVVAEVMKNNIKKMNENLMDSLAAGMDEISKTIAGDEDAEEKDDEKGYAVKNRLFGK